MYSMVYRSFFKNCGPGATKIAVQAHLNATFAQGWNLASCSDLKIMEPQPRIYASRACPGLPRVPSPTVTGTVFSGWQRLGPVTDSVTVGHHVTVGVTITSQEVRRRGRDSSELAPWVPGPPRGVPWAAASLSLSVSLSL